MDIHSPILSSKAVHNRKNRNWTLKEKKIVLAILEHHGHQNMQPFLNSLPHRSEGEIKKLLNKFRKSAEKKLRLKYDESVQETLSTIHPWLPFLSNYCDADSEIHDRLVAFILPFIERFKNHPQPTENGSVDFRDAYRALFNSLMEQKFPENINPETFSMLFASLHQLLDEIRTEQFNYENTLTRSVKRCLRKKNLKVHAQNSSEVTRLPEVNVLGFNSNEINKLCKNR